MQVRRRALLIDRLDDSRPAPDPRVGKPAGNRLSRRLLLGAVVVALVVLGRAFVAAPLQVSSDSMAPTLRQGDQVLVEKLTPRLGDLDRGQLVTFHDPEDDRLALKRVIGLPGDRVAIRDALLYVNGDEVDEPFVDHSRIDALYFGPITVPADSVFLLGDNRARSTDSRIYGSVPLEEVTGRVVVRLWPPIRGD